MELLGEAGATPLRADHQLGQSEGGARGGGGGEVPAPGFAAEGGGGAVSEARGLAGVEGDDAVEGGPGAPVVDEPGELLRLVEGVVHLGGVGVGVGVDVEEYLPDRGQIRVAVAADGAAALPDPDRPQPPGRQGRPDSR